MANNYTLFSEVIPNLTDEEAQWLDEKLTTGLDGSGVLYQFDLDRYPWLHADESADLEQVATFVQGFLQQFRPDQCWSLTFACTSSNPRVGEFSGGAAFVTASDIKWLGVHEFIAEQTRAFSGTHGECHVSRLVQLAEQLGLDDDALEDTVHDIASGHAASVNNEGVAGQIAYLLAELRTDETERVLRGLSANPVTLPG